MGWSQYKTTKVQGLDIEVYRPEDTGLLYIKLTEAGIKLRGKLYASSLPQDSINSCPKGGYYSLRISALKDDALLNEVKEKCLAVTNPQQLPHAFVTLSGTRTHVTRDENHYIISDPSKQLRPIFERCGIAVSEGPDDKKFCVGVDANPESRQGKALMEALNKGNYRTTDGDNARILSRAAPNWLR